MSMVGVAPVPLNNPTDIVTTTVQFVENENDKIENELKQRPLQIFAERDPKQTVKPQNKPQEPKPKNSDDEELCESEEDEKNKNGADEDMGYDGVNWNCCTWNPPEWNVPNVNLFQTEGPPFGVRWKKKNTEWNDVSWWNQIMWNINAFGTSDDD